MPKIPRLMRPAHFSKSLPTISPAPRREFRWAWRQIICSSVLLGTYWRKELEQLTFSQILILTVTGIGGLIVTIVAVRISVNWVDFLEYRRKVRVRRLRSLCPHATVIKTSKGVEIESLLSSPPGTFNFICSQCQLVTHWPDESVLDYWANNPSDLLKRERKFQKAVHRFYKM